MTTATLFARASRTADQVSAEAREIDPTRVLRTLLVVVPFALGWVGGQIFRVTWWAIGALLRGVWTTVSWTWTALVVGFRTARPPSKRAAS